KNSLDSKDMQGIMEIQIVCRLITFYVLVLPTTRLHAILELTKFKIPNCLEELPNLVLDTSKIFKVLDVFHRVCVPITYSALNNQCTNTIPNLPISQLFTTLQDQNHNSSWKIRRK
ncbi:hypothetical protein J3Q64DRAFT_1637769, partial [Phycomyces blakesleeanus]